MDWWPHALMSFSLGGALAQLTMWWLHRRRMLAICGIVFALGQYRADKGHPRTNDELLAIVGVAERGWMWPASDLIALIESAFQDYEEEDKIRAIRQRSAEKWT